MFHIEIQKDETKLLHALLKYEKEDYRKLLSTGMLNINCANMYGYTPLHFTVLYCTQGKKEMVRLLLVYNADVNIADDEGKTPKCYAAEMGFQEIVNMLTGHVEVPERNMCLLQ